MPTGFDTASPTTTIGDNGELDASQRPAIRAMLNRYPANTAWQHQWALAVDHPPRHRA